MHPFLFSQSPLSLDRNALSNFRPVSGLNFVSKLIEKIVASQIKSHMQNSGISNSFQSEYKCGNSTETALLYIKNDNLSAQDHVELTALSLLDLSAAFDTIDHDLLLSRLTEWFGIDSVVLQWVRSYLTGRSQLVKNNGVYSAIVIVRCSARLCVGFTSFYYVYYSSQFNNNCFKHHLYADDTQIYTSFVAEDIAQSLIVVQNYMLAIQVWMNKNMLKLNPSKTEFVIIGNLTQHKKVAHIFPVLQK